MIQNEREIRHEYVLQAVRQMMTAARTAPKGKGIDIIEVAMVTDEDIKRLSEELVIMSGETGLKFFLRDADNILQAEAIMIAGTRQQVQGLNCAHCGFPTCVEKPETVPCAINSVDLGIAVGSVDQRGAREGAEPIGNLGIVEAVMDGDDGCRYRQRADNAGVERLDAVDDGDTAGGGQR